MKRFDGKRVLVTGAARGMGLTIAKRFAAEGAQLLLTDLDVEALAEARASLESEGHSCLTFELDVTNRSAVARAREEIHASAGPIHVLVNNAGVVFGGEFLEVPMERHRLTLRVNVEGLMSVTHTFLPDLIDADESHLVNMASASGFIGLPWGSSYAASKWAVIGFSESIRQELARLGHHHVGVTSVCPGYVSTGMFDGVRSPFLTPLLTPEKVAEKVYRAVRKRRIFVKEPWMVKLTPVLMGVLPKGLTDRLSDLFGATESMRSWRGH